MSPKRSPRHPKSLLGSPKHLTRPSPKPELNKDIKNFETL